MTRNKRNNKVGASAPTENGAGDNVKVDIETEETPGAEAPEEAAEQNATPEAVDDEQALIDAAIAAGEAAADEDFKAAAEKAGAERDELAAQIDAAKAEATDANERFMRLRADWENYRKRVERERVTDRERACEGLVKDLLPAIDDLERAIEHAGAAAEDNEAVKQIVDGVAAVHTKIVTTLEKQGVEVIDPAGEAFDPQDHQAVGRVENTDVYDETVADVYQKGYRMAGKVVRPAMVTVAYGGEKRPTEPEQEPDADSVKSAE